MALQITPNTRPTANLKITANQRARMSSVVSIDWDHVTGKPDFDDLYVAIADTLQVVTASSDSIAVGTTLLAIERAAPAATALALPAGSDGQRLAVVDWSTSVTDHAITLTPHGTETIMRAASWAVYSNAAQLGSLTLRFNAILNGWYIAP